MNNPNGPVRLSALLGAGLKLLLTWLKPPLLWDILAGAGLLLVVSGVWWIYPPGGIIAFGLTLIVLGILGASTWGGKKEKKS